MDEKSKRMRDMVDAMSTVDVKKVKEALRLATEMEAFGGQLLIKNLLTEALAPEPRFYVGQPVLVQDKGGSGWSKRFFSGYDGNEKHLGKYSAKQHPAQSIIYRYDCCKPDPDAVSLPNWVEHDGSEDCPVEEGTIIAIIFDQNLGEGEKPTATNYPKSQAWKNILRYCIIPLPEYL